MAPRKESCFRKFFTYDSQTNMSKCSYCKEMLSGDIYSNLKRHVRTSHPKIYTDAEKKIAKEKEEQKNLMLEQKTIQTEHSKKQRQSSVDEFLDETPITVRTSFHRILLNALKSVTLHGRPFKSVEDESQREQTDQLLRGLRRMQKKVPEHLTADRVRIFMQKVTEKLKTEIANICRNQSICVMIDTASCHRRSFLGMTIQFRKNMEFHQFTLCCEQLHSRHTGEHLKNKIIEILTRFEIPLSTVITVTTDGGSNLKLAAKLLQTEIETTKLSNYFNPFGNEEDAIEEMEFEIDGETEASWDNIVMNLTKDISVEWIRCAAHAVQLAVNEFIQQYMKSSITHIREIVVALRTPNIQLALEREKCPRQVSLDNNTRWSSTYKMVEDVLVCKAEINRISHLLPIQPDWPLIEQTIDILKPCQKLTVIMQRADIIITDVYAASLNCVIELQKLKIDKAEQFIRLLKKRQNEVFRGNLFLSAKYLDPRFKKTLDSTDKILAESYLTTLYKKITPGPVIIEADQDPEAFIIEESQEDNDVSDLDLLISSMQKKTETIPTKSKLSQCLEMYFNSVEEKPKATMDVIKYWRDKQDVYPEVFSLANVIFAIPMTQCRVEGLFSNLKFIFNPYRTRLSEEHINSCLLIRSN